MNVQNHSESRRSRTPDLAACNPEQSPPSITCPLDGERQDNAIAAAHSVSSYGCVEWFRYPQPPQHRPPSDAP
jgi:hypothetical protein